MWSVFFIFLSYLDRNFVRGDFLSSVLDTEKESKEMFTIINDTFCAKMSTVRENFLYQVSDGAEAVRSFVSPAGKLMDCSVIVNQVHVKSFMHECRMGVKELKAGLDMDVRFARMEDAKMMCREFKERSEWGRDGRNNKDEKDDSALQDKVLKRSKRGFTYPGTLWCGAGNMADHYDQLGEFAETDSCCRIHDHCPNVIHAFSSKYGYTNYKLHSICHCDCDDALKACLRKVNDTSSRVVGQAFFNVIGVPCFEFAFEEQCAERHWYGMCKRYQKFPVAVLREAVPYDFGGIDVIDVLTLPPLKSKESKKIQEEKPESTTQSTMQTPEEPSLGNVVTAAEDFIKVLATVSTSQSTTTESDKTETQSSEKKRKKNTGKKKKKNRKHKGKGKGRKRKQKEETGVKAGEGASVSTSGSKAEDTMVLSNFISEAHKHKSSRDKNRVIDEKFELGEREEPSNEVMKDEPALEKEPVSNSTPATDQKKPAESVTEGLTEALEQITSSPITTAVTQLKTKSKRLRKGRRKKGKKIPSSEGFVTSTTVSLRTTSVPSTARTTPLVLQQQSTRSDTEKRLVFSTAGTPIVIPKVKRNRSKEREGGNEKRRVNSASPIEATGNENSSTDNLMSFTGAAPELSLTTPGQPVSHRQDIYGGSVSVHATAPNPSLRALKRRKLKVKGLRSRRRKTVLQLYHNSTEHLFPFPSALGMSNALNIPVSTAAVSQPKEAEETHNWKLLTITTAPSVATKTPKHTHRQHKGSRNKASPRSVIDDISMSTQTGPTQMTLNTTPCKVTTTVELNLQTTEPPPKTTLVTPIRPMSPLQLSIERAKEQFFLKKRRKALMALRQY